jgi:hypothetical protein
MVCSWKVWIGVLVLALSIGVQSGLAADRAGYVLVDKLVVLFNNMASSPDVSYDQINTPITEMMLLAKKAKAEQRIDQQFFSRYARVLRIIKLVITEDKAEILKPISGLECASFVKDITGKTAEGDANLAVTAQAISKELENLKKYLDQKQ